MVEFENIIMELVSELEQFSVDELKEFRNQWSQKLSNKGVSEHAISFCESLVNAIIKRGGVRHELS